MVVVTTTFPDRDAAWSVVRPLVEERWAACVHVTTEVRSAYHWEGRLEEADEVVATCTTAESSVAAMVERLVDEHPYDLPQVLVSRVATTVDYAAWVEESVGGPA